MNYMQKQEPELESEKKSPAPIPMIYIQYNPLDHYQSQSSSRANGT